MMTTTGGARRTTDRGDGFDQDPGSQTLTAQIRAAIAALRTNPAGWVYIADVRAALPHATGEEVDAALYELAEAADIRFTPEMMRGRMTAERRDGGLDIGGEDKHLVSIYAW